MMQTEIHNTNDFRELRDKVKELTRLLNTTKDNDLKTRVMNHRVLVTEVLTDLDVIWKRFIDDRNRLLRVDSRLTERWRKVELKRRQVNEHLAKHVELIHSVVVDFKSLFLFGDILFNRLVLLGRAVYGQSRGVKVESFSSFLGSLRRLRCGAGPEQLLYQTIGTELERIDVLLGFYRDKFIVHVSGPYKQSTIHGANSPQFALDHTSWKLDQFDFSAFNELTSQLGDILPDKDAQGNPLNRRCDPRLKIDVLFLNLHKIKDPDLRQKAEGYIRSVGLCSPNIYYLIDNVKDTAMKFLDFLKEQLERTCVDGGV